VITNIEHAQRFIGVLHGMGCQFALDDFGRGLSSFGNLKNLSLDYLKIDGTFIRNLAVDSVNQAMVAAMIKLARTLNFQVIAEQVEDAGAFEAAKRMGVDFVQGYHLGRPQPPRPRCSHADKSRLRVGLSQLPGTTASKAAYHRDNRSPRESPMMELSLTVNGRRCTVHVDPATTLVEVLRDELGLTGTKIGCDRGACSACTVWIDGEVAASCMTFALDARDKQVTTIEGTRAR
jgi:hypothetical protein